MHSGQCLRLCLLCEGDGSCSPIALNLDSKEAYWFSKLPDLKDRLHYIDLQRETEEKARQPEAKLSAIAQTRHIAGLREAKPN
jgi:hypothetical protein